MEGLLSRDGRFGTVTLRRIFQLSASPSNRIQGNARLSEKTQVEFIQESAETVCNEGLHLVNENRGSRSTRGGDRRRGSRTSRRQCGLRHTPTEPHPPRPQKTRTS